MYYLQSRYYNPEWGRFINADAITATTGELLSGNMFAYCDNNPVTYKDEDGFFRIYASDDSGQYAVRSASGVVSVQGHSSKYKSHSPGVSYDYAGTSVSTVASVIQNMPVKTRIPMAPEYKCTFSITTTMAENGMFDDAFTGIGVSGLFASIKSNHATYKPMEAVVMDTVDKLTWAGGMLAGAALFSVGAPVLLIIGAGLLIGGAGYMAKKEIDSKCFN